MSSAVAELDGYLQSMLSQKPPGVSGSKINSITTLCDANVQSESVLIQKIYTHFKKAPGTHKLGVLYVVDSVTRRWVEQARKAGQPSGSAAPDGTFAAGVNRVTELLPVLMNDITLSAPEDQKDKIKKLVDIWERSNTFPSAMLVSFKEKLSAPRKNVESTTPEGSPAPDFIPLNHQQPAAQAAPQDTSAILAALANMAKTNQPTASAGPGFPTMANSNNVLNSLPPPAPSVDKAGMLSNAQAVNPYGNQGPFANMSNGAMNPSQNQISNQTPFQSFLSGQPNQSVFSLPQANSGAAAAPDAQLQQVQVLQYLIAQGIPQDQWAPVLQALAASSGNPNVATGAGGPAWPQQNGGQLPGQAGWGTNNESMSRDSDARRDFGRSPPHGQYGRRRSRSPGWERRREVSPPGRRGSPVYGDYSEDSPGRSRGDARGGRGGRNDYRQRSPPGGRRRRSPSPVKDDSLPPPGPKYIEYDPALPKGHIKVLSRTLFVGGVTSSEAHLKSLFAAFGIVQTCIVNIDKRHAFVKMINRQDAVLARDGMEQYKSGEMQLRTRWGVGFGPRDCSDYQTGISIIPIERLTDADRKWMLTAEYGGSGGRPIETGMIVEEPDIEIGAGVSSKAISRRMATDTGGKRGPQSTRTGGTHNDRGFRRNDRNDGGAFGDGQGRDRGSNANNNAIGVPPAVPGFGFNFPGMPMLGQNFMMPGTSQQPPGS